MSKSDWITMVFPIIANGILLYLFHKGIEKKFEQDGKRNKLRDEVIILFWKKMQQVNDALISANRETRKNRNSLQENLIIIKDKVFESVQFYDTNNYDLKIFEKEYDKWNEAWNDFVKELERNLGKNLSTQTQQLLGIKLQYFKENTEKFIEIIRKKY